MAECRERKFGIRRHLGVDESVREEFLTARASRGGDLDPDGGGALKGAELPELSGKGLQNRIEVKAGLPVKRGFRGERTVNEGTRFDEPPVNDEATAERIASSANFFYGVGKARIEECKLVKLGGNRGEKIFELDPALVPPVTGKRGPEVQKGVFRNEGFAPSKFAIFPRSKGVNVSPGAVGRIGVKILVTAVHVEADPRIGNPVTTQAFLAEAHEFAFEFFEKGFWKIVPRGRAEDAILIFDMPEVPNETIALRASRVGKFFLKNRPKFARDVRKIFLDSDRGRLQGRHLRSHTRSEGGRKGEKTKIQFRPRASPEEAFRLPAEKNP